MVFSAPRKMIIVNAVPRQMFATMTETIGNEPSQSTGPRPAALKPTFSEPKKKSNIATQRKPAMRVGVAEQPGVVVQTDEAGSGRIEADEREVREARAGRPERRPDEEEREEERG